MASRDLPVDRLATTDETGRRLYVYPADVKGKLRDWRTRFYAVLILIFLGMPWVRIGGHQSILLDIPKRRFAIFGITFWAHDAPMIFFVVGGFALTLFFLTSIWGRVWCGWACPQTVFVDGVFRRIERWIEGDAFTRRKRDQAPMTFDAFLRKSLKWAAFVAVTLVVTHSFLAYFVGTDELFRMIRASPSENPESFLVMLISSAIILFDFGWFREQFCTIACPYGRFQSVLMDDHSMIIGYDAKRGEPRSGTGLVPGPNRGDCVNCYRCVQVCPTGVDIRRGVQLECVACTSCADACDEVMTRLKKPKGLIRYTSLEELSGKKWKRFSFRAMAYAIVLSIFAAGLSYRVLTRKDLDSTFVRFVGAPYEVVTSPVTGKAEVVNHYKIDFSNQSFDDLEVRMAASGRNDFLLVTPISPLPVAAGTTRRSDLFVRFPKEALQQGKASLTVEIVAHDRKSGKETTYQEALRLVGPYL